jgi:hypothetical protein
LGDANIYNSFNGQRVVGNENSVVISYVPNEMAIGESKRHEQEVRVMPYARCSEYRHAMQVEKVSNDVMMMWHGAHCGLAQAYFADEDIFETSGD